MATANDRLRKDHVLLGSQVSNGTAVHTTTARTALFTAITIPANMLAVGDIVRVFCGLSFGITGTPTILIDLGVNTVAVIATAAMTTVTAGALLLEAVGTVRTITDQAPTTGGILWSLKIFDPGDIVEAASIEAIQDTAVDAVATDADILLNWYVTWGTSNASNTATGYQFYAEVN